MSSRSLRPAAHALHARIASQTDVLALETERMIDGLSAEIDRQFARSIQGIAEKLAALAGSPSYASRYGSASAVQKLLADALQATRAALFDQFARLAAWRQRATGAVLSKTLPPAWLARAAAYRRAKPLREAMDFSATPSDRWQDLIFPAPTQQSVSRIVMAPARFDGKTWDQRLSKLSSLADDKAAVATQIVQGMSAGEGVDAIRKRIEPLVAGVRSSAQRIARTEARRVAETAQEASWASLGDLLIGVQFRAVLDERTRPEHRQRNGKIIYKDSPQWATRPQLPDAPNCILPGQVVSGEFVGGLKAHYAGQVVKITTAAGHILRVTPNHPVLTTVGPVAAGCLDESHYLIHDSLAAPFPSPVGHNEEDAPTLIEQVFSSLRGRFGVLAPHSRAGVNLHGDELCLDGNVEIVSADRKLLIDGEPSRSQGVGNLTLVATDVLGEPLTSLRPGDAAFHRIGLSPSGNVRGGNLSHDGGRVLFDRLPLEQLRVGPTADVHAELTEVIGQCDAAHARLVGEPLQRLTGLVSSGERFDVRDSDGLTASDFDSHAAEAKTEGVIFDSGFHSEATDALSGDVSPRQVVDTNDEFFGVYPFRTRSDFHGRLSRMFPERFRGDRIASVCREDYRGFVYDLQATHQWYAVGGLLVFNCRCTFSPVLAEPEALASDPGLRAEFSRAGSLTVPDPATYDDWFAQASTSTRQKAVGVARFNAAQTALNATPNYRDFVTARGDLLSPAELTAESSGDRFRRQMEVQALMGLRRDQIQQIANRGFILREPIAPQIDPVIPPKPRKPGPRTPIIANGLPFVRPERAIASRDVVVMVDVAKLDAVLARDAASYVGRGGVGGIAGRYDSFGKWVTNASKFGRKDAPVEMTELGLDADGRPYIENGRHRFAWLRDQGISQVPVSVVRSSAKAFEKAFGVAAPVEHSIAPPVFRFAPSTARVEIPKHESKPVARASKAIFKRELQPADYASLVGAPANSTVQVSMLGRDEIDLLITGPTVQMNRRLLLRDGRKIIVNEWFGATDTGSGLGTRVFAQQVEQAAAAGVDEIRTLAAAGGYNGYYTWPRLGYNAALPSDVRERLPKYLQKATDLLDLMTTARGRAWWKKNGQAIKVSFDPKPGSRSRQVLDAYVRERLAAGTLTLEAEANAAAAKVEEFVLSAEEDAILDAVLDAIGREKAQTVGLPVDAD